MNLGPLVYVSLGALVLLVGAIAGYRMGRGRR